MIRQGRLVRTMYGEIPYEPDDGIEITIPGDTIEYTYDVMDRLLTATNNLGSVTRTYYKEGTLATETQVVTGRTNNALRYKYDLADRRTEFMNSMDTISYKYNANGLDTLTVNWGPSGMATEKFAYTWDALGRRDGLVYSNGAVVTYGYDKNGRVRLVCSQHNTNSANTDFLENRLWYQKADADGNALRLTQYSGGQTAGCGTVPTSYVGGMTDSLVYNARHFMVQSGPTADTTYTYDGSGNRTAVRSGGVLRDSTIHHSATSNIVYQSKNAAGTLLRTFGYNGLGGLSTEGKVDTTPGRLTVYFYDGMHRLTGMMQQVMGGTIMNPTLVWTGSPNNCQYDALGRRVRPCAYKSVTFDGQNAVRLDADSAATSVLRWRFIQGLGLDDPITAAYKAGSSNYTRVFYLMDGGGRLLAYTDSIGNDMSSQFGDEASQSGAIAQSMGFGNRRAMADSMPGLSFYRNRFYHQAKGKWMNEDPSGISGGVNLWQYAGNNPVNSTDPTGLVECKTAVGCQFGSMSGSSDEQEKDNGGGGTSQGGQAGPGDQCSVYNSSGRTAKYIVKNICERVTGPSSSKENRCAEVCLADDWERLKQEGDGKVGFWGTVGYLADHVACYKDCGYSLMSFAVDFVTGRNNAPPKAPEFNIDWGALEAAVMMSGRE